MKISFIIIIVLLVLSTQLKADQSFYYIHNNDDSCLLIKAMKNNLLKNPYGEWIEFNFTGLKCLANEQTTECACRFDCDTVNSNDIYNSLDVKKSDFIANEMGDVIIDGDYSESKRVGKLIFSYSAQEDSGYNWQIPGCLSK